MPIIRIVDLETDGLAPPAAVIEVGTCDLIQVEGGWQIAPKGASFFHGPVKLDPVARAAHHIMSVDLAGMPVFDPSAFVAEAASQDVIILAAHNFAFEGQWITPAIMDASHVRALCTYKAALRIWPDAPSHSNGALRYWLEDQDLIQPQHAMTMPPHRAGPDAYVTAWILKALLEHATAREIVAWTKDPRLLPKCPIGKQRGEPWAKIEAGFLNWILKQSDMEPDFKWLAQRELDRRKMDQRTEGSEAI